MTSRIQPIEAIQEVASSVIVDGATSVDKDRAFPQESLQALTRAGGLGLLVSTESGGAGGGLLDLAQACEAIGAQPVLPVEWCSLCTQSLQRLFQGVVVIEPRRYSGK